MVVLIILQKFSVLQALSKTSNDKIYYKGSFNNSSKFNIFQI